jgi:hypothetical protein
MLLVLLTSVLGFSPRMIALVTAAFTIPWIVLSLVASREYVATVRKRLSSRRSSSAEIHVDPNDTATLQLLDQAAASGRPRLVAFAQLLRAPRKPPRTPAPIPQLIPRLARPAGRAEALEEIAAHGDAICPKLGEMMDDESLPLNIRLQAPRALKLIRTQASVDTLVSAIGHGDLSIRSSVLKALNSIRNRCPDLDFHQNFVTQQILAEAKYYFHLNAAMAPFAGNDQRGTATGLVARTIQQRLNETLERLFRLLGLRYPPNEMYSAYLAYRNRGEQMANAIEFLDTTLDRDLKNVVLPMLDEPDHLCELGRRLYGFEPYEAEAALREIQNAHDPWLVACAGAAAQERREVAV